MLIQVVAVVILARLLTPEAYGLLAMVVVIVGIGEIFRDFGLSSAAIQAPVLSRQQRDNLFWINTAIGVALATTLFLSAGLVATLYDRPELTDVSRALAGTFVLNGLATQYRADLIRRLRFLQLAIAETTAPAIALVGAILIARAGGGYWALVAQNLLQGTVVLVVIVLSAHWLPRLPRRGVPMRALLRFGGNMVGTQLIGYASNNTDAMIIGLRFGAGPLGFYNRGFQLLMTPLNQLRAPSTTIALPILSRLQHDPVRYGMFLRRGQLALGYTLVAGLGIVVATAHPVTSIFLGPQWVSVAPILRLLAIAGIFQTLAYVGYWVYLSRNLTADLLRYTLVTAAIRVTCIVIGSRWGVTGVAAGYALAPALAWPLSIWWLSRHTDIPARALFLGALRILAVLSVAVGASMGVVAALAEQSTILRLAAACLTTIVCYGVAALTVPAVRTDLASVLHIARLGIRRERVR